MVQGHLFPAIMQIRGWTRSLRLTFLQWPLCLGKQGYLHSAAQTRCMADFPEIRNGLRGGSAPSIRITLGNRGEEKGTTPQRREAAPAKPLLRCICILVYQINTIVLPRPGDMQGLFSRLLQLGRGGSDPPDAAGGEGQREA